MALLAARDKERLYKVLPNAVFRIDRSTENKTATALVRVDPEHAMRLLAASGDQSVFWTHAFARDRLEVIQLKKGIRAADVPTASLGTSLTVTPIGLALMLPRGADRKEVLARVNPILLPVQKTGEKYILEGCLNCEHECDLRVDLASCG
eukprot:TRINITY_DN1780_c0_g1_i6.p1 TRINITY_DN1780_c0_g1~~TRINITY_DN1780_c0_g1_i6.p1  ORF type:complete len:150 (+),score=14.25 TRINITY_DN1780_c0_g1_i6:918-1367(+)